MRPSTLKLLMSTTSIAALAAITGGTIGLASRANAVTVDLTINGLEQDQQLFIANPIPPDQLDGTLTIIPNAELLVVDDGDAIYVDSTTPNGATVNNSGSIRTLEVIGSAGNAINVQSTNTFAINNKGVGSSITIDPITGYHTIYVTNGAKTTIVNEGQIKNSSVDDSGFAAIYYDGNNTGDLTNSGYIGSLNGDAIVLDTSVFTGTISNSGTIEVTGSDEALADNSDNAAIRLIGGVTVTGGIVNSGNITNLNVSDISSYAILVDGATTANITNKSTGVIQGNKLNGNGIYINAGSVLTGNIVNEAANGKQGVIEATGRDAVAIFITSESTSASKLDGKIDNSGIIRVNNNDANSTSQAITVFESSITKGIVNNKGGLIEASGKTLQAINVASGGVLTASADITNSGTITNSSTNNNANSSAIQFVQGGAGLVSGTITNTADGVISITGNAINAIRVSGATVTIKNSGDIFTTSAEAGTHAISFGSSGDIINDKKISNESTGAGKTDAAIIIVDDMTGKIDNGSVTNSKTVGQIFNKNSGGIAIEIAKDKSVSNGIVNNGLIQGGDGTSSGNNGFAIKQDNTGDGDTTITNKSKGAIVGRVQIAQGTFNIEGGTVTGDTTGGDKSKVNFNLAAITPATFNPLTDSFGFVTNGDFTLATNNSSSIAINSGVLKIAGGDNLQADSLTVASGAALYFYSSSTVTLDKGDFTNNGTTIFDTGGQTITGGDFVTTGANSKLGFVVRPDGVGGIFTPLVAVNGEATIRSDIRVYNTLASYTPAVTNRTVMTTNGLTILGGLQNATGFFANTDDAFNDTATLHYDFHSDTTTGKDLQIDIVRTAFNLNKNLSPNEQAAGGALETIGKNGTVTPQMDAILGKLDSITDPAQLANAIKQMLPIANGAALYGSMVGFDSMLNSIDSRLKDYDQAGYGQQYVGVTVREDASGMSGAAMGRRNGIWVRAGGGYGNQDTVGGPGGDVAGFNGRTYYGVVGLDHEVADGLRLGVSGAFADNRFKGNADDVNDSRLNVRNYQGSIYAAWNDASGWWGSLVGGGGYNQYEGRRTISIATPMGAIADTKTSDYDGWMASAKAMLGYTIGDENGLNIAPFASLRYAHVNIDRYTEKGVSDSALNLSVGKQQYDSVLPGVGVRLAATLRAGSVTLVPSLHGSYQYDVIGDRQVTSASFGGDTGTPLTTFTTQGLKPGRQVINGGAGINFFTSGPFSLAFNYDYEWRDNGFTGHSGFAQGRVGF